MNREELLKKKLSLSTEITDAKLAHQEAVDKHDYREAKQCEIDIAALGQEMRDIDASLAVIRAAARNKQEAEFDHFPGTFLKVCKDTLPAEQYQSLKNITNDRLKGIL